MGVRLSGVDVVVILSVYLDNNLASWQVEVDDAIERSKEAFLEDEGDFGCD